MINEMKKNYIYQISTNPIKRNSSHLFGESENTIGIGFSKDCSIITGMNNSIGKTIEAIKNSSLVYINGAIDPTTFFELGLAISLDKEIYYVTDQKNNFFNLQLPYPLEKVKSIEYKEFISLVESLEHL
ncbi:hypothetical protein P7D43_20880 [Enterococcus avium]|uniref:Uncharacterized protein n=1 Tax=Enterococcus avium TaxID=33945 RepID=A0AAW8SF10_ENTAV|nr:MULTISPECIES: hypothetical protein [Enterococcus]MDT2404829.1 hypothetical protein [Enterococcus avium]MDT2434273.1 hypothetical protein [Enterococcus avium]MDT2468226.1 hypothetical protein [Enterococcus avium]MDT2485271.1 hypothetical protein [Enterococcus avium]MDT2507634.1 hypothetical protein [Enterococcus avium]